MQGWDIIFLALVAVFLGLRLRGILGRKTGTENTERYRAAPPLATPAEVKAPDVVVRTNPPREEESPGVAQIRAADPNFDPAGFVTGARGAFEMIVQAFAHGETETLRPLLAKDVFENFAAAIRDRQAQRHTLESTIAMMRSVELTDARMNGRMAEVTVKFVTDQINVTRDADGKVIDGEPGRAVTLTDIWTFARDTRSADPNWQLIATTAQS